MINSNRLNRTTKHSFQHYLRRETIQILAHQRIKSTGGGGGGGECVSHPYLILCLNAKQSTPSFIFERFTQLYEAVCHFLLKAVKKNSLGNLPFFAELWKMLIGSKASLLPWLFLLTTCSLGLVAPAPLFLPTFFPTAVVTYIRIYLPSSILIQKPSLTSVSWLITSYSLNTLVSKVYWVYSLPKTIINGNAITAYWLTSITSNEQLKKGIVQNNSHESFTLIST